jgi:CRP-like cAMP-binding protein/bacterioferritin-associated ferredoxin
VRDPPTDLVCADDGPDVHVDAWERNTMDGTLQSPARRGSLAEWMSPEDHVALVRELRSVSLQAGERLFSAGDAAGSAYLVTEGTLEIRAENGRLLDTVGPGSLVGEQALMPGGLGRRNASILAETDCRLLELDRDTFAALLETQRQNLERMSDARMRARLSGTADTFRALLDDSEERRWEDGAHVFREGDAPDGLYIVLSGRARVLMDKDGESVHIADIFPGQVFGEAGVLEGRPRSASVVGHQGLRAAFVPAARVEARNGDDGAVEAALRNIIRSRALPNLGTSSQHSVVVRGEVCIQTTFTLDGGRELIGLRTPSGAYTLAQTGAVIAKEVRVAARTLVSLDEDWRIVGFEEHGDFEDVGGLQLLALEGTPLSRKQRGALAKAAKAAEDRAPESLICRCVGVDRQTIAFNIDSGITTLKGIQAATGAGTGCGGCLRKVAPMLSGKEAPLPTVRLGPPVKAGHRAGGGGGIMAWLRSVLRR